MTLVERVSDVLDRAGLAHALVGAAALAARGVARSTYDIDLMVDDARVLEAATWHPLDVERSAIDIRRGDHEDPLGGVIRISVAGERPVDVILCKHGWQSRAIARAERIDGGLRVVLARDLILLKLYAGGSQDLWDIRELLRILPNDTIVAEVDADLPGLPPTMQQLWAQVRADQA